MGPTNIALVKLFQADQQLRAAQEQLDSASKGVRIQQRRVDDLAERQRLLHANLMDAKSKAGNAELDLKTRDAQIERLRTQQQNAKNNKEYQTFLIEINTQKVDKAKIEEELLVMMEGLEKSQAELTELSAQLEGDRTKLATLKNEIGGKLEELQKEIDAVRPARDAASQAAPQRARDAFDRLAVRLEGEALSAVAKPDRRREEYICSACNMDLVVDVYNKLHTRDDLVTCPSCHRILYIPEDLPPEAAVHKKKAQRAKKVPPIGAITNRQESAVDVLNSMTPDEEESAPASDIESASVSGDTAN